MTEIWKDIPDYEGLYQASNLGRIKSLGRKRIMPNGGIRTYPEKVFKPADRNGYLKVDLHKNGKAKSFSVHRLVWEAFNGKTDLPIDHIIEKDKKNNRLSNLQALSVRDNTIKYVMSTNKSSKYIGVSWHKMVKKWTAKITINNKRIHLGCFDTEIEAANAFQKALTETKNSTIHLEHKG